MSLYKKNLINVHYKRTDPVLISHITHKQKKSGIVCDCFCAFTAPVDCQKGATVRVVIFDHLRLLYEVGAYLKFSAKVKDFFCW